VQRQFGFDNFKVADHPEGGQIIQYKRVL
jgi:hypothetical protein